MDARRDGGSKARKGLLKLRPYQQEALTAIESAQESGLRRVLLALPTGAGKTVIFSALVDRHLRTRPSGRALVLAHRKELVEQAQRRLAERLGGHEGLGVEMGDARAASQARVVVASIRSLSPARLGDLMEQGAFDLIVYDECHHSTATQNKEVLRRLGVFEPDFEGLFVGVTATTRRADGEGLDQVFEEIVYARSLSEMIDEGYLRPLRGYTVSTGIKLSSTAVASEDDTALADAVDVDTRNALVARAIQELARDRRTIAFCITVSHAERLARALNYFGVRAGMVCGAMPKAARKATLEAFAQGKLSVITNVGVLTEGFDDPGVSAIAMVRPTRSESLYIQCVGRGMRISPEAQDCLVLDFVDACRLDLVTLPSLAGLPRAMNLEGERLDTAVQDLGVCVDWLADVVEEEDISLSQLKARAQAFDPLTQTLNPELQAVSNADWFSLGPRGVGLYVQGALPRSKGGEGREASPLEKALRAQGIWGVDILRRGSGKAYRVYWDGVFKAEFSRLVDAVQAVDYELERASPSLWASAQARAKWRSQDVPPRLAAALQARGRGKLRKARVLHEALRQLRWLDRFRRVQTQHNSASRRS